MPKRLQTAALILVGLFAGLLLFSRNGVLDSQGMGIFVAIVVGVVVYNLFIGHSPTLTKFDIRMMSVLQKTALVILVMVVIATPLPILLSGEGEDVGVALVMIAPVLIVVTVVVYFYFWATLLYKLGQNDLAIQHLSNLLRLRPKSFVAYRFRAALLQLQGNYNAALLDTSAALRSAPDHPLILIERASLYIALGSFPQAIADCDRAQTMLTRHEAGTYKGTPFVAQDYSVGEKLIIQDLIGFKKLIPYHRAIAFYLLDDYARAIEDIDAARVEADPKYAPLKHTLWLVRAMSYQGMGKADEAKQVWSQIVLEEPQFNDASWVMERFKTSPHLAERVQAFLEAAGAG